MKIAIKHPKNTHVQNRREAIEHAKDRLCALIKFDTERYNELRFELGCQWAEKHCVDHEAAVYLNKQPEFWGWFKQEFETLTNNFFDAIKLESDWHYVLMLRTQDNELLFLDKKQQIHKAFEAYMSDCILHKENYRLLLELGFHKTIKSINQ
jgi:hypothetical protein